LALLNRVGFIPLAVALLIGAWLYKEEEAKTANAAS